MSDEQPSMDGVEALSYDLRKPEEVKEYMKNLRIEYQYQCHREKLVDGCQRLANFLEVFAKDLPLARTTYEHTCTTYKDPASCFKHASYAVFGRGGKQDVPAALRDFGTACDLGHFEGCYHAALTLQSKDVGTEDFQAAKPFLEKACNGKHAESCHVLSTYYLTGKPGIAKDMKKAFNYAKFSCDKKEYVPSCVNLSVMYKKGDGVDKNIKLAQHYRQRATDLHKLASENKTSVEFGK